MPQTRCVRTLVEPVGERDRPLGGLGNGRGDGGPDPGEPRPRLDRRARRLPAAGEALPRGRRASLSRPSPCVFDEPLLDVAADVEQQAGESGSRALRRPVRTCSPATSCSNAVGELPARRHSVADPRRDEDCPRQAPRGRCPCSPGSAPPARRAFAELRAIDRDALRRGRVDHVHRDDDRLAQIEQLAGEVEVPVEVGRIDDGEDHIRSWYQQRRQQMSVLLQRLR